MTGLRLPAAVLAVALCMAPTGCGRDDAAQNVVVVYTALDQIHSEPVLKAFEHATGIAVRPVYDAEDSKTTGLVSRLIARRDHPDCDVHWNNEIVQTVRLARMRVLQPYRSPSAERMPPALRDPEGRWTGFAARMRVVIYNTGLVKAGDRPTGLAALADVRWRGRAAMARPFFGTTLTHMAVLYQRWGPERLGAWLAAVRANETALCPGNASVCDMVAAGERAFGLTDTDDARAAMQAGKPVRVLVPDAAEGALLIPNTVALVAGCPHPQQGKRLIDYLLSAGVERRLARSASAQIPLGTDLAGETTPWDDLRADGAMPVDWARAADAIDDVVALLRQVGMDQ